jgi:dsRNA-specific ribonuclease
MNHYRPLVSSGRRRLDAWLGDALLLFLARILVVEHHPDVPLKHRDRYVEAIVNNRTLRDFGKPLGLAPTDVEREIYLEFTRHGIDAAKSYVNRIMLESPDPEFIEHRKRASGRGWPENHTPAIVAGQRY